MAYGHLSPEASRPKFPTYLVLDLVAALAPPLHHPALPHCPLVSCSFLSTPEPCCWRRALPWAKVVLSGLGVPQSSTQHLVQGYVWAGSLVGPHIYTFGLAALWWDSWNRH